MTLPEINNIKNEEQLSIPIGHFYEYENYCIINRYISFKVDNLSSKFKRTSPVPITLGTDIYGDLIFTKHKGEINIDEMTEYEFISFLTYANEEDYYHLTYNFDSDFLLIKEDFLLSYISDYEKTSMLWGGFSHPVSGAIQNTKYQKEFTNIELGSPLKEFDYYSYESCIRAIEQPYAFERFLKLYHLLELQFDYFIIERIKDLTVPADSNKIGKILNEYSHKELDRLTELIDYHCSDIIKIETFLAAVSNFPIIAEDMFMNFSKSNSSYHLGDITKFRSVVNGNDFTSAFLVSQKVHQPNLIDHKKFIISLTSYWIYRIRCSIAHNKIGEYLLSWNDEIFIVEFGEPLLKEVLMQCFKE
jgi:hypothetical protein